MHLTLHLTDRCNMACSYCYARRGQTDMMFVTATRAIERCAEGRNCGIIFFGGEPLLRQDLIWDIIDWCEKRQPHRFHYKVTTNGLLLDREFLRAAHRKRLHVALSLDGVREAHDRHRVTPEGAGTFAHVAEALRLLLAARPYSPVLLTVTPETVGRYARSVRWLQQQGARYVIASLNYAGGWTPAHLRRLKRAYQQLAAWHLENYRRGRKFYFSPLDRRIATHIHDQCDNSCRLGYRQISVGPDGRLFPCVQFVGRDDYAIGSADHGLDEARRRDIFELNEQPKPDCAGCALIRRCHNRCGCLNIQTTGRIDQLPPLLCEHERMVFAIADQLAETLYAERNALFLQRHYDPAFPIQSFLEDLAP